MIHKFILYILFFKLKTAYEMRISDWRSDVCSSDLYSPKNTQCHNFPARGKYYPVFDWVKYAKEGSSCKQIHSGTAGHSFNVRHYIFQCLANTDRKSVV